MMKIYIDMIAFYLQKAGGITSVWKELLIRMLHDGLDIILILQDTKCENIYFKQIMELSPQTVYERGKVFINRYMPVRIHLEKGSKFISTYYRKSSDKLICQYVLIHDFTYEYYATGMKKLIHSWQKKNAVRSSQAAICVSENTKKDLLKFYPWVKEKDIYVIYNGVNEVYQKCPNTGELIELGKYNNIPFLLYVGSRVQYKRFDIAVKTAGECGYGLVIIGGGTLQKREIALLNENVKDNYLHITKVQDETLNRIYNKAFALIYPSEYEGFGIPIIEAQRAGCPVIACRGSSVSEIVRNESMLMESCSVQEAKRIIDQLKNQDKRNLIELKGFENAKEYIWEKAYKEYVKVLLNNERSLYEHDRKIFRKA